jgi:hypothetical protein
VASSADGCTLASRWRPKGAAGKVFECVPVASMKLESSRALERGAMLLRYRILNESSER